MTVPRYITASEVLAERQALRAELGHVPHGTGSGWSSYLWVYCDCPNCRDQYDPTGEESAKYLNMDHTSFFREQSDTPSFAFSKIAKDSFCYNATPGFYLDSDVRPLDLPTLISRLMPPLAVYPTTILRIEEDGTWDEFVMTNDNQNWVRRTHKKGRSVFYSEEENPRIPFEASHEALRERLIQIYSNN